MDFGMTYFSFAVHKNYLTRFFFAFSCFCSLPSQASESLRTIQKQLIDISQKIQIEEEIIAHLKHEIVLLSKQDKKILLSMKTNPEKLIVTLHHLRHLNDYSPVLSALSSSNPEDLIHTSVLLRSMIPEMAKQHGNILNQLKELVRTRVHLQKKLSTLKNHDLNYRRYLAEIAGLSAQKLAFQKRYGLIPAHKPSLETILPVHQEALIAHIIEKTTQSQDTTIHVGNTLQFKKLAVGKIVCCQENILPQCPNTSAVLLESKTPSLVTAPFDGMVVYTGIVSTMGGIIIINYYDCFLVLTGLDSITVDVGQIIVAGEPIGRFAGAHHLNKNASKYLAVQLWQQGHPVNPRPYLESAAYVQK